MSRSSYDHFKHARKSIRYKHWDYRSSGFYFITICTKHRHPFFTNEAFKAVAAYAWGQLARHWHIQIDEYILMPEHLHGIIEITEHFSAENIQPEQPQQFRHAPAGSIGALIGSFKGTTTERINKMRNATGNPIWHRGYWDRIIRTERELHAVRQYIRDNPRRHAEKRGNLDTLLQTRMTHHP